MPDKSKVYLMPNGGRVFFSENRNSWVLSELKAFDSVKPIWKNLNEAEVEKLIKKAVSSS